MDLPDIGCKLQRLAFDFRKNRCVLTVEAGACPDMTAAVTFVTARFPTTTEIWTFAGGHMDTAYKLDAGDWHSFEPEPF
jgi:hypothetical protein